MYIMHLQKDKKIQKFEFLKDRFDLECKNWNFLYFNILNKDLRCNVFFAWFAYVWDF